MPGRSTNSSIQSEKEHLRYHSAIISRGLDWHPFHRVLEDKDLYSVWNFQLILLQWKSTRSLSLHWLYFIPLTWQKVKDNLLFYLENIYFLRHDELYTLRGFEIMKHIRSSSISTNFCVNMHGLLFNALNGGSAIPLHLAFVFHYICHWRLRGFKSSNAPMKKRVKG